MTAQQLSYEEGAERVFNEALPPGTVLLNGQYMIERYLSSGGFGITYLARDSLDRAVVIKECFPEAFCSRENKTVLARSRTHMNEFKSFVTMFVREAHSIAKLKHPNIVGVHQVFEDNETAYMALDLIEGQDLLDTIESGTHDLAPDEIKTLLLKVLDAIATVHAQDMLHRDISPDNILLDAWGNPILIDFGAAREEASKKSRALSAVLVVKDGYSPQEFYIAGSQQTPCSDLYALAATFFHLISGKAPPNSQIRLAAIASNKADPYEPLAGRVEGYEPEFLMAIDTTMNVFPADRLQSAQDWILQIDSKKRREAALARAQSDKDIEKTVLQLITKARQDAEAAPIPAAKAKNAPTEPAEMEVAKRPEVEIIPGPYIQSEDEPVPVCEPEPGAEYEDLTGTVSDFLAEYEPDTVVADKPHQICTGQTAQRPVWRRAIKRKLARLILGSSLMFFLVQGHATRAFEYAAPFVHEVLLWGQAQSGIFG